MASNVSASTRIWATELPRARTGGGEDALVPLGGRCDHLRSALDAHAACIEPRAGELMWISDATPHESLRVQVGVERSYFRLVTSDVSVWWARHSTPNPRVAPPPHVRVIEQDKFACGPGVVPDEEE